MLEARVAILGMLYLLPGIIGYQIFVLLYFKKYVSLKRTLKYTMITSICIYSNIFALFLYYIIAFFTEIQVFPKVKLFFNILRLILPFYLYIFYFRKPEKLNNKTVGLNFTILIVLVYLTNFNFEELQLILPERNYLFSDNGITLNNFSYLIYTSIIAMYLSTFSFLFFDNIIKKLYGEMLEKNVV